MFSKMWAMNLEKLHLLVERCGKRGRNIKHLQKNKMQEANGHINFRLNE